MNKKQIVKKAVAKYTGKGGPGSYSAGQIRQIRANDDVSKNKKIKIDMSKAQSPLKAFGNLVKSVPVNAKALMNIYRAKKQAKQADIDTKAIKEARKYGNPRSEEGGASSIVDGKITEAGKARSAAMEVKSRIEEKIRKNRKNY